MIYDNNDILRGMADAFEAGWWQSKRQANMTDAREEYLASVRGSLGIKPLADRGIPCQQPVDFVVMKDDQGVDGWDAKTMEAARFSTHEQAMAYITFRGHTFVEYAGTPNECYAHADWDKRHCMGKIDYRIEKKPGRVG